VKGDTEMQIGTAISRTFKSHLMNIMSKTQDDTYPMEGLVLSKFAVSAAANEYLEPNEVKSFVNDLVDVRFSPFASRDEIPVTDATNLLEQDLARRHIYRCH